MELRKLAHSRTGDKGDISNISVIAYDMADYELLRRELSAERVRAWFEGVVEGEVLRYELPRLGALNFVMHKAPGRGGDPLPGPRHARQEPLLGPPGHRCGDRRTMRAADEGGSRREGPSRLDRGRAAATPSTRGSRPSTAGVAMRDGVLLRTRVLMPEGGGSRPVVLIRNPYPGLVNLHLAAVAPALAKRGYAVAVQECRGHGKLGGRVDSLRPRARGRPRYHILDLRPGLDGR